MNGFGAVCSTWISVCLLCMTDQCLCASVWGCVWPECHWLTPAVLTHPAVTRTVSSRAAPHNPAALAQSSRNHFPFILSLFLSCSWSLWLILVSFCHPPSTRHPTRLHYSLLPQWVYLSFHSPVSFLRSLSFPFLPGSVNDLILMKHSLGGETKPHGWNLPPSISLNHPVLQNLAFIPSANRTEREVWEF